TCRCGSPDAPGLPSGIDTAAASGGSVAGASVSTVTQPAAKRGAARPSLAARRPNRRSGRRLVVGILVATGLLGLAHARAEVLELRRQRAERRRRLRLRVLRGLGLGTLEVRLDQRQADLPLVGVDLDDPDLDLLADLHDVLRVV